MSVHMDTTCPRCKTQFGWWGEPKNCPPCPSCGYRFSAGWFKAEQEAFDEIRELLRQRREKTNATIKAKEEGTPKPSQG